MFHRFFCIVLAPSWAPFWNLFGAQVGSSSTQIVSWHLTFSKTLFFKNHCKIYAKIIFIEKSFGNNASAGVEYVPFDAKISYGEYLAGDEGMTIDLSRSFPNGTKFGIFASFTDVSTNQFDYTSATSGTANGTDGAYIPAVKSTSVGTSASTIESPNAGNVQVNSIKINIS